MMDRKRGWLLLLGMAFAVPPAQANFFDLPFGIHGEYKLALNYGVAMRMQKQKDALIHGGVDELQIVFGPDSQGGIIGFERTGLPVGANFDDGNRNFNRYDLIFNRVSALAELVLDRDNLSFVFSGSGFYDDVYHNRTSNRDAEFLNRFAEDSPATGRDFEADDSRRFSDAMKSRMGRRARVLDAYGIIDLPFGNFSYANIRVGQHMVSWGESLFFGGMMSAQSHADATKAFVPGVEIKDILLPAPQISARVGLGTDWTLLGYYKFRFRENEIFPAGDYFNPSDAVGPGAQFVYGSINPLGGEGCPGLMPILAPILEPLICESQLIAELLDAHPYILATRDPDIRPPDSGQWGVGLNYRLTPNTSVGLHYLRYHNPNPAIVLNTGFAPFGELLGIPLDTGAIGQAVPVTYNIKYFDGIKLISGTFSTTVFGISLAGELNYRDGQNIDIKAMASGVPSPVPQRGKTGQILMSGLHAWNPRWLFDEIAVIVEAGYVRVLDVDKLTDPQQGIEPVGDGDTLFFSRDTAGFQVLILPGIRNIISGWDFRPMLSYQELTIGNPAQAGSFSALFGEGDRRLSLGASMQYLQNFQVGLTYNFFWGNANKTIDTSPVHINPFVDRDYVSLNVGYNF